MTLPNFALIIKQKFFPRSINPIQLMRTPLIWLETAIFWGFALPWTILLVLPLSSIMLEYKCFSKLTILLSGAATTSVHLTEVKAQTILTISRNMRLSGRFMSEQWGLRLSPPTRTLTCSIGKYFKKRKIMATNKRSDTISNTFQILVDDYYSRNASTS